MSTSQAAPRTERAPLASNGEPASEQADSTELLDLLSDEYVREMLACLGESPQPAAAIADELGASRATIYRRLDRLTDAGLVRSTVSIDPDGHHRQEFRVAAETATIRFGDEGVTAAVNA